MKAGILTFHYAHHYGAQLQAYALMQAIRLLGVDCEIINYVRKDNIEGSSIFRKGLSPRSVLSNIDTLLNYSSFKKRHDRFNDFVSSEMKLSEKFYGSYEELREDPPVYDVYVCGSDQIWNPLIFSEKTYDPAFCGFRQKRQTCGLRPSFGISSIPEDKRDELAGYLENLTAFPQGKTGRDNHQEIAGREAVTVLDPTLLLTAQQWSRLAAAADKISGFPVGSVCEKPGRPSQPRALTSQNSMMISEKQMMAIFSAISSQMRGNTQDMWEQLLKNMVFLWYRSAVREESYRRQSTRYLTADRVSFWPCFQVHRWSVPIHSTELSFL